MVRLTKSMVLYAAVFTALIIGCGGDDKQSKDKPDAGGDDGGAQDSGVAICTSDTACSDGKFCNGAERCDRGDKGADDRGCVVAQKGPCDEGKSCDESSDKCQACTDNADVDRDNHKSIACGGDDCDDNDANRYPDQRRGVRRQKPRRGLLPEDFWKPRRGRRRQLRR